MNEKQLEKYVVVECEKLGAEVRKLKFIGHRGAPDRIVMYEGATFFVEFKSAGESLKPHQEREIDKLKAVGQRVYVVNCELVAELFIELVENRKHI